MRRGIYITIKRGLLLNGLPFVDELRNTALYSKEIRITKKIKDYL